MTNAEKVLLVVGAGMILGLVWLIAGNEWALGAQ